MSSSNTVQIVPKKKPGHLVDQFVKELAPIRMGLSIARSVRSVLPKFKVIVPETDQ